MPTTRPPGVPRQAFVDEDDRRQRVIASYRRLSAIVDRDLHPADADLAQLAIGAMLEKLGVIFPPIPPPRPSTNFALTFMA